MNISRVWAVAVEFQVGRFTFKFKVHESTGRRMRINDDDLELLKFIERNTFCGQWNKFYVISLSVRLSALSIA